MAIIKKILHRPNLLTALVLLFAVGIAIVVGLLLKPQEAVLQGFVETTDYRVATKVPSRVVRFCVEPGQRVSRGDTLVVLSAPELTARATQANAARDALSQQEAIAENGNRAETIAGAWQKWQQALAAQKIAEQTYGRMERLFAEGVISEQKRDEAVSLCDASRAATQAAQAAYEMMKNGSREEEKRSAAARTRQAEGAIDEVATYLAETVLTATADGVVTEIFPEVGELVGTGAPIMNVDTDDHYFVFNVREDHLPGITLGDKAVVWLPALDRNVEVRVSKVKNIGDFAAWKPTRSLDRFDLKMFEVQARPLRPIGGVRNGMSAILKK